MREKERVCIDWNRCVQYDTHTQIHTNTIIDTHAHTHTTSIAHTHTHTKSVLRVVHSREGHHRTLHVRLVAVGRQMRTHRLTEGARGFFAECGALAQACEDLLCVFVCV
jgi:hypothetical protein